MIQHDQVYQLEKLVWSDADFEQMGWHDARIHGIAFNAEAYEFYLDIDYIYEWVDPPQNEKYYSFWVSPCSMIFSNVYDLVIDLSSDQGIEVADLHREEIEPLPGSVLERVWKWTFECQEGDISFKSDGFRQYTRRKPAHIKAQHFLLSERGGISFKAD